MARNGNGTYQVPNTFEAGATITAASHNQNWADLASELTNSLALDGQSAMSGVLKAANGSAAAPAIAFGSDLDTGAYRSAADEFSVAAGGAQVLKVGAAGVDAAAGRILQGGAALRPPGGLRPSAGAAAPAGYLLCAGQLISRTTYAALFAAIGITYGSGDGSTTFKVPDLRGRVVAGRDNMDGDSANRLTGQSGGLAGDILGNGGGAETHTLTLAQAPQDNHTVAIPEVAIKVGVSNAHASIGTGAIQLADGDRSTYPVASFGAATFPATNVSVSGGGGGGAHNNVQPTIILNYIIKT